MQHLWKKLILEGSSTNKDMPKKFIAAAKMWASVNVVKKTSQALKSDLGVFFTFLRLIRVRN